MEFYYINKHNKLNNMQQKTVYNNKLKLTKFKIIIQTVRILKMKKQINISLKLFNLIIWLNIFSNKNKKNHLLDFY